MSLTEQQQLISDTFHYRPPDDGTSFFVNEPGLRLISSDASFLPSIKTALLQAAQDSNGRKLLGSSYVIGAFLVLSTKYSPDSLVPFIQSLPSAFMKEVVANVPVWFNKNKKSGTYNFEVAPPRDLVEFIRELARGENPPMKKTAERALRFLNEDAHS